MSVGLAKIDTNILSVTPPDGDNRRVAVSNNFLKADGECFFYRRANFFAALRTNGVRIYMIEGLSAPVDGFGWNQNSFEAGIERRVHTSGKSKSMMDPFQPEKEEDVARLKRLLGQIHENFITHVRDRRADKLAGDPDLFTGEIWVGASAKDVGLIDGIGHITPVMKERFGDKVKFRRYGAKRPLLQRFGAQLTQDALGSIEERAEFARYGL
ncbi:Na(+)/H(+) antiporter NhaA [Nymphon striatum]|nr:Na(+)/H(+) antiporter NhaA [Nymphon striatum]